MAESLTQVPVPHNEPVREYAPGSREKASLKARLGQMLSEEVEIPLIVGGKEIRTGRTRVVVCPHDHGHVLARAHLAGPAEVEEAIRSALAAWKEWSALDWEARSAVFLGAADLLAGPWRDTVNSSTMLGQSKTAFQAEIDSACELIDFWRFNCQFAARMYAEQPLSARGVWNRVEHRPLEGFILAVTPFNFTSIAGNLPTAPALMGNVVVWKPASTAVLSAYYVMKVLEAAGLPAGVINFLPGSGAEVAGAAVASPHLAGLHFTGSTSTFQQLWKAIGNNLASYRSYPRIVGETGGKGFVFAHASADVPALAAALIRGAFEYQGQKCSAASRAYIPRSLWSPLKSELEGQLAGIRMGPPTDFRNFLCAVIDEGAFDRIAAYLQHARSDPSTFEILWGGGGDKSTGYYIEPTIVVSRAPRSRLMAEEIFAPVLTVHVYEDGDLDGALELCDTTSPYALTGAVFARDRQAVVRISNALRHAAGNYYINDKPTGAVVGQQPFGGSRASGTNDKAGSALNLHRWVSPRCIKENFAPPAHFAYPHMEEE